MNLESFGLSWTEAATVSLTAVGLYLVFLALVRVLGPRILTPMSSLDVIVVITMGAVLGRAILGVSTDLSGGAVALVSLLAIQAAFSKLRRWNRAEHLLRSRPVALVHEGVVLTENVARIRLDADDLWARLRLAGFRSPDDVALMTMESTGQISVIRRGEPIEIGRAHV